MKNYLLVSALVLMVGLVGCGQTVPVDTDVELESSSSTTEVTVDITAAKYTLAEVAMHSEAGDCWMVIDNKVYDVSEYQTHPGGEAILEGCGQDATELFETRPMGSGTPHSAGARNVMADYYIGDLEV